MVTLAFLLLVAQAASIGPRGEHPRLEQTNPPGRREKLSIGTLFIPAHLAKHKHLPLLIHFHGDQWVPEVAAAQDGRFALISVQTGSDSDTYSALFSRPDTFGALLREASKKTGITFGPLTLTAWSAGYGAIRQILQVPAYYSQVQSVLLIDGLHADYKGGKTSGELEPRHLQIFLKFATDAVAGHKHMIITHSEIVPGTFASTTETADWITEKLGLEPHPMVRPGPMGTRQLSEVRQGRLLIVGYAGNSGPDHVDQYHSLPFYLKWLRH